MDLSLSNNSRLQDVQLDALDEQILWELVRDARISNNDLAKNLHVSPSTTINRVRALKAKGVLESAHATINLAAVGLPVQAVVSVRIHPQARAALKEYAQRVILLPPVMNLFFMGGPDDFLIHVHCASTAHLRDFVATDLSSDPAVALTQTHVVFDHLLGAQHMDHVAGFGEIRAGY
ncbi:Lrp/AsnC family transcriptional regulator [Mycolicibacterium baixiangningiae]|uniref:Lrp/AsnC family transcriptional regulator n=1 Tax=Mycolicibacterium baixiangningiae TaxID=2761578 RepID=UPI0018D1EB53|nr:Lrp/AsnC family transcriptional regulator [Mycolicibacterium baixiangningiae]